MTFSFSFGWEWLVYLQGVKGDGSFLTDANLGREAVKATPTGHHNRVKFVVVLHFYILN